MEKNKIDISPGIIVIGGSAGSLDVIIGILPYLAETPHCAVILIMHRRPVQDSPLTDILAAKTSWPVKEADEKEKILPGQIYIVPADYHLLMETDYTFTLDDSEKVNFSRPSIDVTFESAAEVYGCNTLGVLLSGANADGVEGMKRIKEMGGTCIVQTPESAEVSYMPEQAIRHVAIDHILSMDEIGRFIRAYNPQSAG